ncbi:MAG: hypothetical protein KDN19_15370 [Verrucomicrobiae bacterium]|nr:hypothetical protein [Verrucomicrobiae bacterium]
MRAATLKALLIHTADDLGNPGPDYSFGWGLINAKAAADVILAHAAVEAANTIVEGTLDTTNTDDVFVFDWDGASPIRVTLAWTDPAGTALSGLDDRTKNLVNDLDLSLEKDGVTWSPYILDVLNPATNATTGDNSTDTVERIDLASPTAGTYTLTVSHKGNLSGNSQAYSLVITGQTATEGGAAIAVSPSVVTTSTVQGSNPGASSFNVYNSASGTLDYTVSEEIDWLTVSPTSGSSTGENDPISLTFDSASLPVGVYTGEILVESEGLSPRTVTVQLSVTASSVTLAEAVDQGSASLTATGNAAWFGQSATTHDGSDAGRSGAISHGQSTGFTLSTDGPAILTFWWKTDSESGADFARFSVDGAEQASLSGATDWERVTAELDSGTHTLAWSYEKDGSGTSGADAAWVDEITLIPTLPQISRSPTNFYTSVPVGENADSDTFTVWNSGSSTLDYTITDNATWLSVTPSTGSVTTETDTIQINYDTSALDPGVYNAVITIDGGTDVTPEIISVQLTVTGGGPGIGDSIEFNTSWTQTGDADWFGQSAVTYDGVDAAQAGDIEDNEESSIETTVTGPGTLSWWWKVSSESRYDYLYFDFNGSPVASISGTQGWIQQIANIGSGTHTIRFRYAKDNIISRNQDTGWVDQVTWTPGSVAMTLGSSSLTATASEGNNPDPQSFTVRNSGTGGVLHYEIADNASWLSLDPTSGTSTGEADTINVSFNTSSLAVGSYSATISVGGAGVTTQTIPVSLTITEPAVTPVTPTPGSPYLQDFSGTVPLDAANGWSFLATNTGRIVISSGALRMDDAVNGRGYSYNHAVLHVNLAGRNNVTLEFDHRNWGDEIHTLASTFSGNVAGDGVSISADGTTWHVVDPLNVVSTTFRTISIDLDQAAATAGISLTSDFQIKFQQYDDSAVPSDGFDFDNILVRIEQVLPATGLTATDGTHTDRVSLSWTASTGATLYRVYRNTVNDSGSASAIGSTTTSTYNDLTAAAGQVYYYWVRAENGSDLAALSDSDSGYRLPAAPTGLTASDGSSTTEIGLSWNAVSGADGYSIYRHVADSFGTAQLLTTTTDLTVSDTTASPATIHHYWIVANAGAYSSAASSSDTGFLALMMPTGVSASSDLADRIDLQWSAVDGAEAYAIYRNDVDAFPTANLVGDGLTSTSWTDTTTSPGETFFYWVKAISSVVGDSEPSDPVSGQRLSAEIDRTLVSPGDPPDAPDETPVAEFSSDLTGNYWGLLESETTDPDEVRLAGSGRARVTTVGGTGLLTLVLDYAGQRYVVRGAVTPSGAFTGAFIKADGQATSMTVSAQFVDTEEGRKLTGSLTGDGDTTTIDLFQRVYHPTRNPAPEAGRYTLILPVDESADHSEQPGGDGAAYGTLRPNGVASLRFFLGDGTRTTANGYLSPDGQWMFYQKLYPLAARGGIGGILQFRDEPNISTADGILHWTKAASSAEALYPDGFDLQQPVIASLYTPPNRPAGERMLSELPDTTLNALVNLSGGNVPTPDDRFVTWDERNRITWAPENTEESLLFYTVPANGFVRGRYRNSSNGLDLRFFGVAFQTQGLVSGNFVGDGQTGAFLMDSLGHPALSVSRASNGAALADLDTLDFGDAGFEGGFTDIGIRISNTGDGRLAFSESPTLSPGDGAFALVEIPGGSVDPGASSRIMVRFQPDAEGAHTATLTLRTNDEDANPFVLTLTGTGIAGDSGGGEESSGVDHLLLPSGRLGLTDSSAVAYQGSDHSGNYEGLLFRDGAADAIAGQIRALLTDRPTSGTAALSATVWIEQRRRVLRGTFDASGAFTGTFSGAAGATLTAEIQIQETGDGNAQLVGAITDSESGESYAFVATHHTWNALTAPAPQAGRYTALLPIDPGLDDGYPGGDGVATLNVATNGIARAVAYLGDGTRTTWTGRVSGDGELNVFRFLDALSPERSTLAGVVNFRDVADTSDFDGVLQWTRSPNSVSATYPDGFQLRQPIIGSLYTAPTTGQRALSGFTSGTDNTDFLLSGAGLSDSRLLTWDTSNVLTYTPVGSERIVVNLNSTNGFVTGYWWDRGNTNTRVNLRGILFQKQDLAGGYFYYHARKTGLLQLLPK